MISLLSIIAGYVVAVASRKTFVLRLKLHHQMVRGTHAAISQHGLLDGSPGTLIITRPGYATVRPEPMLDVDPCTPLNVDVQRARERELEADPDQGAGLGPKPALAPTQQPAGFQPTAGGNGEPPSPLDSNAPTTHFGVVLPRE